MSIRFNVRFYLKKMSAIVAIGVGLLSLFGVSTYAQNTSDGDPDRISTDFFQAHMLIFMVACEGLPEFIPLTENSPRINFRYILNEGLITKKVVWLEPNCKFLFSKVRLDEGETIPGQLGFVLDSINMNFFRAIEMSYFRLGLPTDIHHMFFDAENRVTIGYYTDSNMSGDFDASELYPTDDLNSDHMVWAYTYDELNSDPVFEKFYRYSSYDGVDGISHPIAEYHSGPLDGHTLYIISTLSK